MGLSQIRWTPDSRIMLRLRLQAAISTLTFLVKGPSESGDPDLGFSVHGDDIDTGTE